MTELETAFSALPPSPHMGKHSATYDTIGINLKSPHRIAKSSDGCPCLLILTQVGSDIPAPLRLQYLNVQHGLRGKIHFKGKTSNAEFSLIQMNTCDLTLIQIFLRFAAFVSEQLSSQPDSYEVASKIRRLVTMLQSLRQPRTKTIQGLWGELFVINKMSDKADWTRAWHSDPLQLHDFLFKTMRLEIKSSATRVRKHKFSHYQLCPPEDIELFVASLVVEKSPNGMSVFELADRIREEISGEEAIKLDELILATLGADCSIAREVKFDLAAAGSSLRFYPLSAVPKLPAVVPDGISDITYTVILSEQYGTSHLPQFVR